MLFFWLWYGSFVDSFHLIARIIQGFSTNMILIIPVKYKWPHFNINMSFQFFINPIVDLHNGISYAGKTTPLYCISTLKGMVKADRNQNTKSQGAWAWCISQSWAVLQ